MFSRTAENRQGIPGISLSAQDYTHVQEDSVLENVTTLPLQP